MRCGRFHHFNPPAPCGAGQQRQGTRHIVVTFQSTRPVRGGTQSGAGRTCRKRYFNPPAPCGAGRFSRGSATRPQYFNPPAPCGAGLDVSIMTNTEIQFQSTRPVRGGTPGDQREDIQSEISIHPPRAGRDQRVCAIHLGNRYFNPPAPCGAGPIFFLLTNGFFHFNPPAPCGAGRRPRPAFLPFTISIHPPRAGRDVFRPVLGVVIEISIHPPRAGRDKSDMQGATRYGHFNPPAPCGAGPPAAENHFIAFEAISIHPPRAGRDTVPAGASISYSNFNPPAPCGAGQQSCTKFTPCILA